MIPSPYRTTVPDTSGHVRLTLPDSTGRTDKTCNVCLSGRQVSGPVFDPARDDRPSAPYRVDLSTLVHSLTFDFRTHTGRLILPDLCCADMSGCIRLFTAIDPHVIRIETLAGDVADTTYVRDGGNWAALPPEAM